MVGLGLAKRALRGGAAADAVEPPGQGAGVGGAIAFDAARARESARILLNKGEPAKAEVVLRALLAKRPADGQACVLLGEALLALERAGDAHSAYVRAIEIEPDHGELRFAVGTVASAAGLRDEAASHFASAEALAPSNPKHPLYLAQVQRAAGKIEEARASLVRALALDPDLAIAHGVLADIALGEGDLAEAMRRVDRAVALDPMSPAWRIVQARALRRSGRDEEAALRLVALGEEALCADIALLNEAVESLGAVGREGEAASLCVRASGAQRDDGDLAALAAAWLERAGRIDDAEVFASAAATLGSERGKALLDRLLNTKR